MEGTFFVDESEREADPNEGFEGKGDEDGTEKVSSPASPILARKQKKTEAASIKNLWQTVHQKELKKKEGAGIVTPEKVDHFKLNQDMAAQLEDGSVWESNAMSAAIQSMREVSPKSQDRSNSNAQPPLTDDSGSGCNICTAPGEGMVEQDDDGDDDFLFLQESADDGDMGAAPPNGLDFPTDFNAHDDEGDGCEYDGMAEEDLARGGGPGCRRPADKKKKKAVGKTFNKKLAKNNTRSGSPHQSKPKHQTQLHTNNRVGKNGQHQSRPQPQLQQQQIQPQQPSFDPELEPPMHMPLARPDGVEVDPANEGVNQTKRGRGRRQPQQSQSQLQQPQIQPQQHFFDSEFEPSIQHVPFARPDGVEANPANEGEAPTRRGRGARQRQQPQSQLQESQCQPQQRSFNSEFEPPIQHVPFARPGGVEADPANEGEAPTRRGRGARQPQHRQAAAKQKQLQSPRQSQQQPFGSEFEPPMQHTSFIRPDSVEADPANEGADPTKRARGMRQPQQRQAAAKQQERQTQQQSQQPFGAEFEPPVQHVSFARPDGVEADPASEGVGPTKRGRGGGQMQAAADREPQQRLAGVEEGGSESDRLANPWTSGFGFAPTDTIDGGGGGANSTHPGQDVAPQTGLSTSPIEVKKQIKGAGGGAHFNSAVSFPPRAQREHHSQLPRQQHGFPRSQSIPLQRHEQQQQQIHCQQPQPQPTRRPPQKRAQRGVRSGGFGNFNRRSFLLETPSPPSLSPAAFFFLLSAFSHLSLICSHINMTQTHYMYNILNPPQTSYTHIPPLLQ
jgi:hypothetical protein